MHILFKETVEFTRRALPKIPLVSVTTPGPTHFHHFGRNVCKAGIAAASVSALRERSGRLFTTKDRNLIIYQPRVAEPQGVVRDIFRASYQPGQCFSINDVLTHLLSGNIQEAQP